MNNLIIKNLKTRLAVNLDFVKELEVPAKLIDRTSEVINNNDGTINAGSTLTYMITKNDFSEAINKYENMKAIPWSKRDEHIQEFAA